MGRKRQILDIGGIVLGLLLMLWNGTSFALEYAHRSSPEYYVSGIMKYFEKQMLLSFFLFIIGIFVIWFSLRDFALYRRYKIFQSVCAKREYVEIRELAQEGHCSLSKAEKSIKRMVRRNLFPEAVLDAQGGMLLFSETIKKSYEEAWALWNEKQKRCLKAGVSLEDQELFLQGKIQAEEIGELAKEVKEQEIQKQLKKISDLYMWRYEHVEEEIKNREFLKSVCTEYLPQVKNMVSKYIQMGKLEDEMQDTLTAERIRDFLKDFPQDKLQREKT